MAQDFIMWDVAKNIHLAVHSWNEGVCALESLSNRHGVCLP